MDLAEFRKHGHDFVDWMADYLETVEQYPVRSQVKPGEIAARLPPSAPEKGEDMAEIFANFRDVVLPGMTHWQHPSFFAFFTANSSPPSVLAEMLTATLAAQCMLWETSPAATEIEERVLDWLRQLIGLPEGYKGVIQDTASSATLCAILTARERSLEWRSNETGLHGLPPLAFYTSEQTHSSVEKAVGIAGVGKSNLRLIASDEDFAIRVDRLEQAIQEDRGKGIIPSAVIASLGATGVGAIDPLGAVGEVCRRHQIYLHVDAAWAGSALILPEARWMIDGIELADSFVFNPHKWLFTNFDCSAHFVRDPGELIRTFSILPEYLKTREGSKVTDYRDWGIALGRRFRALKLWFVLRSYGAEALRTLLRNHIAWTAELGQWIHQDPDFELTSKPVLGLLSFRYRPSDEIPEEALNELNETLLHRINDDGRIYLTKTKLGQSTVIRFNIGQTYTTQRHVAEAWKVIRELACEQVH